VIYGLVIITLSYIFSQFLVKSLFENVTKKDSIFINRLFYYHFFLSIVYYIYALSNPSDSIAYYNRTLTGSRGSSWGDYYGTSTPFIEWIGYPFIKYFGFSYEAIMALFAFFGFVGFIFFYKFFKERIYFNNKIFGYNLVTMFLLLPNLHFWSGSFGKGSLIFLGIALIFYALNRIQTRWILLIVGSLITYHIRPHIMFVIVVSSIVGFTFSTKGLNWGLKLLMISISFTAFFFIYQDVLTIVGIEQGEEFTEGLNLTHRATELSKATSGIDITSYSLPEQLFTFLYRPLFFDAPGLLGIIVSFENVFLLLVTIYFLYKGGIWYIIRSDFLVKTAFFSFITVSIALAQISGNLGIAIRQKSQVMLLFLFVIVQFLDEKKLSQFRNKLVLKRKKESQLASIERSK